MTCCSPPEWPNPLWTAVRVVADEEYERLIEQLAEGEESAKVAQNTNRKAMIMCATAAMH